MPVLPFDTTYDTDRIPRDPDGGVPVNQQDQTTPPIFSPFLQSISNFTLSADSGVSGETVIDDQFEATAGHGIAPLDEIILLDVAGNRDLYCQVISVATNTITVDRPIDHDFLAASTLGRIVTSEIKTDGSSTRQFFTIRSGIVPADIQTICINIECTAQPDDSKFGDQAELARGLVLRINDGFQKTIGTFKTNGDFKKAGGSVDYIQKSGGGTWSVNICLEMKIVAGVVLRIEGTDYIQVVNQDAQGVISIDATAIGHLTQGEV